MYKTSNTFDSKSNIAEVQTWFGNFNAIITQVKYFFFLPLIEIQLSLDTANNSMY